MLLRLLPPLRARGCRRGFLDLGSKSKVDPGRNAFAYEYASGGDVLHSVALKCGGHLEVTRHDAAEWLPPAGSPLGSTLEWRVMRFRPASGTTNLLQSVTKVESTPSINDAAASSRALPTVLALDYTKTMPAAVLAALGAMGRPVLPGASERLRMLAIGLGAGTMPTWLTYALPHCDVDVVELEAAVLRAATGPMGFRAREGRLRVRLGDGAAVALNAVARGAQYDAVLVDAYDPAGDVPAPLLERSGGLASALSQGLLRPSGGVVAVNLLPHKDPLEPVAAYRTALGDSPETPPGPGFVVSAEGCGNHVAVQTGGVAAAALTGRLEEELGRSAAEVEAALGGSCTFDLARLATRHLRTL